LNAILQQYKMGENNSYNIYGVHIPQGTMPCWFIDDEDRLRSIKNKDTFAKGSGPSCYFKINQRLDNNFIEGYLGHTNFRGAFHDRIDKNYTYFSNYLERKSVYFSFDRVSLYRLMEINTTNSLTCILKRLDALQSTESNKVFMIMPFKHLKLNSFYLENIKNFLHSELRINVFRADDFNDNDIIIDTIYKQIEQSEFIIADTSYPNKNAFLELGYAVGKNKEIITIQNTRVAKSLFFDRAHIRAILYSPEEIAEFHRQLKNTISAIRSKLSSRN